MAEIKSVKLLNNTHIDRQWVNECFLCDAGLGSGLTGCLGVIKNSQGNLRRFVICWMPSLHWTSQQCHATERNVKHWCQPVKICRWMSSIQLTARCIVYTASTRTTSISLHFSLTAPCCVVSWAVPVLIHCVYCSLCTRQHAMAVLC